jgi:hypothetical protein
MLVFIGSGLFIGGLIGARRSVLALIPAAILAVTIAVFASLVQASVSAWSLYHLLALLVFLQLGYLAGAFLRLFAVPARVAAQQGSAGPGRPLAPRFWTRRRQAIDR